MLLEISVGGPHHGPPQMTILEGSLVHRQELWDLTGLDLKLNSATY